MKTNFLKRVVTRAAIIVAIFTVASCASSQEKSGTSADAAVPPSVDIHTATVTGDLEAVRQHIRAGSNLNERDPFGGSSPLISAAVFGKTAIARELIEAGVDLNVKNNDGSTALITAAFFCRPEIVQMLLEKGADKSMTNNYGATAYQSVAAPFAEIREAYDMMRTMLSPMGLSLDYEYIEKTRPVIAEMLK